MRIRFLLVIPFFLISWLSTSQENADSLRQVLYQAGDTDYEGLIQAHHALAWAYRDSRPDSALFHANKSLQLSRENDFEHLEIKSINYVGVAYRNLSNFSKAFEKYLEALKLSEERNDGEQRGYSLINLGNLYLYQTNFQGAITYFIQALDQAQALANQRMVAYCYLNLGRSYKGVSEYGQAELYFKQAIEIRKNQDDVHGQLAAEIDLAEVYMMMNEYDRSLNYYKGLIKRIQQSENPRLLSVAYNNVAKIYLSKGNLELAKENAFMAIAITKKVNSRYDERNVLENLSHIYEKSNEFNRAFDYHVQYAELNQQLFSEENIRKIEQLKNQYQIEQQEAENEFLKRQSELNQEIISRQRIIITLAVIGVLLFLSIALIYIRGYIRERKLSAEIREQKETIESDKQVIEIQSAKLKELDVAKSRFFANVSHDLRTPLSLIMGNLEMLSDNEEIYLSLEVKQNLDTATKNCKRLLYLTDEINDLTRLEEGRVSLKREVVRLGSYLAMLSEMFKGTAEFKGVELVLKNGLHKGDKVAVDPRQFEKIFYNLISNAIRHTNKGEKITIETFGSADYIHLNVIDTGEGIPSDSVPHIFDRFYQSKENEYRTREGLGIGLALVKELVELHEGEITVESTLGLGTSFQMKFPKVTDEETSVPISHGYVEQRKHLYDEITNEVSAGINLPNVEDQQTVLLVDDHPEIRYHLRQLLESDFQLLEAAHGIEALELLKKYEVDLIITDLMMPWMDGFELIEAIKTNDDFNKIPILVVSARISDRDQERVLLQGVNDYLQKPFQKKELIQRISNLLKQKEQWGGSGASGFSDIFAIKNLGIFEKDILHKIEQLVMDRIDDENLSIYDLADVMAASERQVYRLVKKITGLTPYEFIMEIRMKYVEFLLRKGKVKNPSEAARSIGLKNVTTFSRQFEKKYGVKPSDLLNHQA